LQKFALVSAGKNDTTGRLFTAFRECLKRIENLTGK
jgi:hypothetical protein